MCYSSFQLSFITYVNLQNANFFSFQILYGKLVNFA
jgi:hypothetical protein